MSPNNQSAAQADNRVVVIGSGPAGAAATLLLTRAGVDVTLLEAGLPRTSLGLTARIAGLTVVRVHRPMSARTDDVTIAGDPATVLYEDVAPGGLSNHWSCAVPRFSPDDFLDGRRAGEEYTWPIEYQDLAPWYDWIEPFLHISGSATDVPQLPAGKVRDARSLAPIWNQIGAAAQLEGQAIVPMPYVYGARTTLTLSGTVFNAFVRLVKPALQSGHLAIQYGARVTRLEWSGDARRVTAVIVRDTRSGSDRRIPCRAVVLAAGAINSAKILLQSTSNDFPGGLGNTDGVLGRYLHDHPLGKLIVDVDSPLPIQPAAYLTRQPLNRSIPLYAAACLQWSGAYRLARSLLQGHFGRLTSNGFSLFGTMAPSRDNFVALDTSRPSIDGTAGLMLKIHYPAESAQTLANARDQLLHLLDQAKLRPRVSLWHLDGVGSAIHYAGTCRMHALPRFGMLDRWSRLHAVRNVVVADSAAFTTGSEKNPVLTAMALAGRASQRLCDDLQAGII